MLLEGQGVITFFSEYAIITVSLELKFFIVNFINLIFSCFIHISLFIKNYILI